MKNDRIMWFGRYEGYLRMIAKGVRNDDPWAIECAAKLFDLMLPTGSVVVPMPGHLGAPVQMLAVAKKLAERRNDIRVWDYLFCEPHESNYDQKKYRTPDQITMHINTRSYIDCKRDLVCGENVFVIDNVICTGVTASAALEVLPNATVVALAVSNWR